MHRIALNQLSEGLGWTLFGHSEKIKPLGIIGDEGVEGTCQIRILASQFEAIVSTAAQCRTFHDLRHTAVSYMMMNGIDLKTIAELVGHTTAQMVDQRYGHLSPDHKRVASEIYGAAMDRLCGYAVDESLHPRGKPVKLTP